MSPTTKISGCPGRVRSGKVLTRPARSISAPVCSASCLPNGLACTPAAQIFVTASIRRRPPSASLTSIPVASIPSTMAPSWTSMPSFSSLVFVFLDSRSAKPGSTRGAASSRMIRASRGSIRRKSPWSVRCASSAIWPAISTPVGPAPTMTNVMSRCRTAGSSSSSASSKAPKMLTAQLERVVDALHAGRELGELVVAEVGLTGARGDDEAVVRRDRRPLGREGGHRPRRDVDRLHVPEQDGDVATAA